MGIGSLACIVNLLITPVANVLMRLGGHGKGTEDFSYLCLVTHLYSDKLVLRRIQYFITNI